MKRVFFFILSFIGLSSFTLFFYYITPPEKKDFPCTIEIHKGETAEKIGEKLYNASLLRSKDMFLTILDILGVERTLKAGEYKFWRPHSIFEIIKILQKGKVYLYKVTIPEGFTMEQIASVLAQKGLCEKEHFLSLCKDKEFIKDMLGYNVPSLEGYLFATTYFFPKGLGEAAIIKHMVKKTKDVLFPYFPRMYKMGMSMHEVLTLSSIIEKESAHKWERFIISGVFHNRLKRGMKLQADPTVMYGLKKRKWLTYSDLRIKSPYNTYRYWGLPPTPICSPSFTSIYAALFPADVPYFYFVSKGNGTHYFSSCFEDHVRAKQIFRERWQ